MKTGIAGAGIIGKLLAFALVNNGCQVTLFDHDTQNNCSMAAAGLLTPISELEKNELIIYKLGIDALNHHWPSILNTLSASIFFQKKGSLIISHPGDHAELNQFLSRIVDKLKKPFYEMLTENELAQLEPDLVKTSRGLFFPHEGQIDNQELLNQLDIFLKNKNVLSKNETVTSTKPYTITTRNNIYLFDIVFDCRGMGATEHFNHLRGVRGELIWLHAPHVTITRPIRFLHPRYSLYLVPRPNQIYILGASEIEVNDYSAISVRTTLELLTAAYYLNSKLTEARIVKSITHCRPTLTHHLPCIKHVDGLIAINGLYRHGFLIAPALAHDIIQWLEYGTFQYPELWEAFYVNSSIK